MIQKREVFNFNTSWKFYDGDITEHNVNTVHQQFSRPEYVKAGNNGLAYTSYDDSSWKLVNLPHDFVIERNEFDTSVPSCTGSMGKGIVWYRRSFNIPEEDRGRRIFIQFDGIHRDCQVWLNGNLVGRHVGGYMGFELEITDLLNYGKKNSFAVKVDVSEFEGWWYEGGGIYRDVRLVKTSQLKIEAKDVFVETKKISVEDKTASLVVSGSINCGMIEKDNLHVEVSIISPNKEVTAPNSIKSNKMVIESKQVELVGSSLKTSTFVVDFDLDNIELWDIDSPKLYQVSINVCSKTMSDDYSTKFGLRTIKYSAAKGFELNGRTVKLQGVNGHDDFACVGTALTRPIIEFKVDKLMEMGVNSYRCAHNPPDPKFLEYCDEVGLLVMDETRLSGVNSDDLGDYVAMLQRDRNHPSVIAWSMGNEEMAIHATEIGVQIYKKMTAVGEQYDTSRPFLYAINADYDRIVEFDRSHDLVMNPVGLNYFVQHDEEIFATMHEQYPDLCMINTETTGVCSSREFVLPRKSQEEELSKLAVLANGEGLVSAQHDKISRWKDPKFKHKITCYGSNEPVWGMDPETSWKSHVDKPYSAGVYLWTGFDYRGEVFPYDHPAVISFYGVIDLCGFEKDWFYYLQSNWTDKDVLHLLPHWNLELEVGEDVDVWAFTSCDEVELLINGESKGRKVCEKHSHVEWAVTYEPGLIEAVGYKDGVEILRDRKVTAGKAETLVLNTTKSELLADHEDACIITAHLEDLDGNLVITSEEVIEFEVQGPGVFLGSGNGDHFGTEPDTEPRRSLFVGKCIAAYRSTFEAGDIVITGKWNDQEVSLKVKSRETECLPIIEASEVVEGLKRAKAHADGGI